jgi:hypothetical protein
VQLRPPEEFRRPDGRRIVVARPLPRDSPEADGIWDRPGPQRDFEADALQPTDWDGGYDLDTTVFVLQQQIRAVLPHHAHAMAA